MAIHKDRNREIKKRAFIISWNNYPPSLSLEDLKKKIINLANVEYLILGFEKGKKKETPHIQGYVRFTNAVKLGSLEKLLKNDNGTLGYCDIAFGNDKENQNYDSKEKNFIEYGYCQNAKEIKENTELYNLIDDIINKMNYTELCKKYYKYILYHYRDFKELYQDIREANKNSNIDLDEVIKHIDNNELPF